MRRIEIVENKDIAVETKEAALVRNLQECINIFNNISKEIVENKIKVEFKLDSVSFNDSLMTPNAFNIQLTQAVKEFKTDYVQK